jgi:hypothetical protein
MSNTTEAHDPSVADYRATSPASLGRKNHSAAIARSFAVSVSSTEPSSLTATP